MVVEVTSGVSAPSIAHAELLRAAEKGALGMDFDTYRQEELKTLWILNAQYKDPATGIVKSYDYVVVNNYRESVGSPCLGCANLDSMWREPGTGNPRWPIKPLAFLADPNTASFNWLGPPASLGDSIGFAGNPVPSVPAWPSRTTWSPELGRGWHETGDCRFAKLNGPGVNRDVLLSLPSVLNGYRSNAPGGLGGGWSTPDWDSSVTSASDSAALRVRYRADGAGNGIQPPFVVAALGAGTTVKGNLRKVITALAIVDSAAANGVFFQTRPGPVTFNVQCNTIGATGRYDVADGGGLFNDFGIFEPAGSDSDRAGWKSTIDALSRRGVRMSFGVQLNPDSAAYQWQADYILNSYPLAKVYPYERAGLGDYWTQFGGPESAGGNDDASRNYDAFGAQRLRSLLPSGCADPRLGCDCSTDTTSVLCHLLRLRDRIIARFGRDRLDRVWSAPLEDFTPTYFGRSAGSIDSLKWVLYQLVGLCGIRVGNHALANNAYDTQSGSPRGWTRSQSMSPVRDPATNQLLGFFAFLPSRDSESAPYMMLNAGGHDNASEFLVGLLIGMWFPEIPSPLYVNNHDFYSRPMIFEVPASWLGGSGDPRYEWRMGLNYIADFDDFCKLLRRLAGRDVVRMGYGEDVADWFWRSGLR